MSDMNSLFREVIMDNYKNPRNKGLIDDPSYMKCHIKNPSCGDEIDIQSKIVGGIVQDVREDGNGCSICCASASIMSEVVKGKTVEDAKVLLENYLKMVSNQNYDHSIDLDELQVFDGIKDFPARVRCASIASQAMLETLKKEE